MSEILSVHFPMRLRRRGGRKEIVLPEGADQQRKADKTLVKALARAFRWKRMLESGEFATIAELAEREGIAPSYMTRVLRLTLLAPDIVEAALEGRRGTELSLALVLQPFSAEWQGQRCALVCGASTWCDAATPSIADVRGPAPGARFRTDNRSLAFYCGGDHRNG